MTRRVGTHGDNVADVVPNIVRYRGGIARIVFGDAGLNLADEVCSHVRRLGIDASPDTRKQCNKGCSHGVSGCSDESLLRTMKDSQCAKHRKERPCNPKAAHNLSLIHISEPTRLGMISYAVFCLKKK